MTDIEQAVPEEREDLFRTVVHELARHEASEEVIVRAPHPA